MVNIEDEVQLRPPGALTGLVIVYVASVVLSLAALSIFSAVAPREATSNAWGHEIVVAIFAVVLPLRLRAARNGSNRARMVVGIIALVLILVNVVEAAIPGFVPTWMRIEMLATAVLMAVIAMLVFRGRA